MRGAIRCPLLVAAADIALLFSLVGLVSLLIEDAAAIGAEQHTREQAYFIIAVGAFSKARSLEVCPGITVVGVPAQVCKAVLVDAALQSPLLVENGIALALPLVLVG